MNKKQVINKKATGKYVNLAFSTKINDNGKEKTKRVKARIHYREKGEGQPLLLLHEVGQSCEVFRPVLNLFARNYRVIAPDLIGHGLSECPDLDYVVEDFSLFIEAFITKLELSDVIIVACGQSAAYALDYVHYNKENVQKMVLINPGAYREVKMGMSSKLDTFLGGLIIKTYRNTSYIRKQLEKAYFDKTALSEQYVRLYCRPYERNYVMDCVRMSICNFSDEDIIKKLSQIMIPILYLKGGEDFVSNPAARQDYIGATAMVYEMTIRNCGALPYLEKPEQTFNGIMHFLND